MRRWNLDYEADHLGPTEVGQPLVVTGRLDPSTTVDAQFYWTHHPVDVARYRSTAQAPYRDWAIEAVQSLAARTVLELGCHCGPLLRRLEEAGFVARGIDINGDAVAAARLDGLQAEVGAIPSVLSYHESRSVDVVLTSYCLAYIAPVDLVVTLMEMLRVSARGLVIIEPFAEPGTAPVREAWDYYVDWRHDYLTALALAQARLAMLCDGPLVEMRLMRKQSHEKVNGVLVATLTWPVGVVGG